ncbi:MAG: hypothetical protein GC178_16160 [Flavobacteriales bacterium]|nr:hypothetical protein [Flavobacteriales bacterium]
MAALTEHEPSELLYQSQLMNFLTEELEGVSFSPSQTAIDKILAYSKAVEVKKSETVMENHVIMMN